MKILVAVKRVVDAKVKVRPLPDHSGPDIKLARMAMNPFDEIAVEEAVELKEAGKASEVVAVSIGGAKAVDVLRTAMAIGADRAIHVVTDDAVEPLAAAKILRYPLGAFASEIEFADDGRLVVTRETDGGTQTVSLSIPAVITADLRLAEPRYVTLPSMAKARKKPVEAIPVGELDVDLTPRVKTLSVEPPPARKAGVMVSSVDELVEKLRNEAHVI